MVVQLATEIHEIRLREPDARAETADGVHEMRVAARRLRSSLATTRRLFDPGITEPLRTELGWLGSVLGEGRDVEVTRDQLVRAARRLTSDLRFGPVLERVETEMAWRARDSHVHIVRELDGLRYRRLLDRLDLFVREPPVRGRAARKAGPEIRRQVRATVQRLERAAADVDADGGAAGDEALHDVRKAAKRARYAAEAATATLGRPAEILALRTAELQTLLGEVQDAATARATLVEIGITAHLASENGFSYGVLHAEQRARAESALLDYPRALRRALRAGV